MTKLEQYLDRKNAWARITKTASITIEGIKADPAIGAKVADMIECDLSPENLCGDGEISRTEVNRRFALFSGAKKELAKLGFVSSYSY